MLRGVFPGHVVGVVVALRSERGIPLFVQRVIDVFQPEGQELVLGAAKRRGEPVHDAQELLRPLGRALLERSRPEMPTSHEMLQFASVVRRKQGKRTHVEWGR